MAAPNPTTPSLPLSTLGPLIIALILQAILFGMLFALVFSLLCRRTSRVSIPDQLVIVSTLLLNTVECSFDSAILYRTVVIYYGQGEYINEQDWALWSQPGTTAAVAFITQLAFIMQCSRFAESRAMFWGLLALSTMSLASGLAVSVSYFNVGQLSEVHTVTVLVCFWLTSTATTDLVITIFMAVQLVQYSRIALRSELIAAMAKLFLCSLETGGVVALVTILNLALFLGERVKRCDAELRVPLAAPLRRLHQLAFKAGGAEVKRYDVEVMKRCDAELRVPLAAPLRRLHQLAFKAGGAEVKRYDVEFFRPSTIAPSPAGCAVETAAPAGVKAGGAEVKRYDAEVMKRCDAEVKLQRSLRVPLAAPLRRLHQLAFKAGGAEVKRYDVESSNGRPDSRWPYRSSASHFDASRSLNAILSLDSGTALPQHLSLRCVVRGHRIRVPGGQCGTPDRMLVRMKEHQLVLDALADADLITTLVSDYLSDALVCAVLYPRLRRSCAFATSSRPSTSLDVGRYQEVAPMERRLDIHGPSTFSAAVSDVVNGFEYDLDEREPGILRRLPHLCCVDQDDQDDQDIDHDACKQYWIWMATILIPSCSSRCSGSSSQTLTKRREDLIQDSAGASGTPDASAQQEPGTLTPDEPPELIATFGSPVLTGAVGPLGAVTLRKRKLVIFAVVAIEPRCMFYILSLATFPFLSVCQ
ncbi:hypothetical protein C8R47DRAFT_1228780 [Mycena vitilis]|nr:hypothetical protein C8R47DRAFT_1228780 [Mycena vitilis]